MTRSEAGRLGALQTKQTWIRRYLANPKFCKYCNQQLSYKKRKNKFCDRSCAACCNNAGVCRNRVCSKREAKSCLCCNKKLKKQKKYCSLQCIQDHAWEKRKEIIESDGSISMFSSTVAKRYLLEKSNTCNICGCDPVWQNNPLVLIMDHVDGNSDNWDLSNLRLVCPNCDSQLPTYKSKNRGSGRHYRRIRYKNKKSF
jgi:hypothetical protein